MSRIGLPETFRFAILNSTGIAISNAPTGLPRVSGRRVRFDGTGTLSYEAAQFVFFSFAAASIGNNSYIAGSTLSNTASAWMGGEFLFSAFASGGASGALTCYLEISPDGGTTWPTPASAANPGGGIIVGVLGFASTTVWSTASTTQRLNFEL
jgi:hypothetical protein